MAYFTAFKRTDFPTEESLGTKNFSAETKSLEKNYFLVPDSFSILAASFQVLWCLYHKLWQEAGILFLISLALSALEKQEIISVTQFFILSLIVSIFVGLEANYWRKRKLLRQGFTEIGPVFGFNKDDAIRRILDNRISV